MAEAVVSNPVRVEKASSLEALNYLDLPDRPSPGSNRSTLAYSLPEVRDKLLRLRIRSVVYRREMGADLQDAVEEIDANGTYNALFPATSNVLSNLYFRIWNEQTGRAYNISEDAARAFNLDLIRTGRALHEWFHFPSVSGVLLHQRRLGAAGVRHKDLLSVRAVHLYSGIGTIVDESSTYRFRTIPGDVLFMKGVYFPPLRRFFNTDAISEWAMRNDILERFAGDKELKHPWSVRSIAQLHLIPNDPTRTVGVVTGQPQRFDYRQSQP